MENILEKIQGEWTYKEEDFTFSISGEDIIVDGKIKSVIGLKKTGDGWQMCLQPLGSTMVIIKSIENDTINLYDLTQETGIINLANCPTFSIHRK